MRVAFLAPASSVHTARWVNALCQRGIEVTLFSLDIERDIRQSVSPDVEIVYLKSRFSRFPYIMAAPLLRQLLKKGRYDIVNAHYASSYGLLARMAGARPLVLSVWGSDVYEYPYTSALRGRILRRSLCFADRITSTSHAMAEQVQRLVGKPKSPIAVIPFGVDTGLFNNAEPSGHEGVVVGIAKMLEPQYDIACLIAAFRLLTKMPGLPSLELVICGDGSERPALEALAADPGIAGRVRFMGHLSHPDLARAMRQMDVFALSSRHESFGVAAVEAMAAGLPVVATDVDGFREVVEDGVTGLLIPAGDARRMADALASLAADKKLRLSMGDAGRQRAKRLYDWDSNVSSMIELYRGMLPAP